MMPPETSVADRAARFVALHDGPPFVIPNPWDAGSARVLEAAGFQALATTSSGFAFTLGRADGTVQREEMVGHVAALTAATELPLSADLENGYGADPSVVAETITAVANAGAVGGSIEDWDRDEHVLYEPARAAERVRAAAEAAHRLPFPFLVCARAENHIRDHDDLDDTIARLRAYEGAGADVLFAPGLRDIDDIRRLCGSVGKPVNVLVRAGMSVDGVMEAGAQRISVGGGLAWVAASAAMRAAAAIRDGDLSSLVGRPPDLPV
jgi:2-methylisocitrate lyase-like PEP mutase family enzyme